MSATPSWLGATSGSLPVAGQVNQFLGTHNSQYLYAGVQQAAQTTLGSVETASNGVYMAQSFTTGASQTAVGYVSMPLGSTVASGSSLAPIALGLYANSGGAPGGSPLVTVTATTEYMFLASGGGTASAFLLYPLPATVTPSTEYWLVTAPMGSSTFHYHWYQSNQTSGASTSTTGSSWSAQAYGFAYRVFDQSASGLLTATFEDSGARWTALTYNSLSQIASLAEYTVGQTASGYTQGYRALTYSNGLLTKAA